MHVPAFHIKLLLLQSRHLVHHGDTSRRYNSLEGPLSDSPRASSASVRVLLDIIMRVAVRFCYLRLLLSYPLCFSKDGVPTLIVSLVCDRVPIIRDGGLFLHLCLWRGFSCFITLPWHVESLRSSGFPARLLWGPYYKVTSKHLPIRTKV